MMNIIGLGVRGFMMIASAVVLGLSVTLAKHQAIGGPPPETSFGSFTGAFGILAAAVGIVAIFFDSIPSLVPLASDALAAVFFLAGGIALTMAMKDVSCTADGADSSDYRIRYFNKILNGGCDTAVRCAVSLGKATDGAVDDELKGRCVRAQADFAFQYIAFIASLGALLVTFLSMRRSGNKVFA